MAAQHSAQHARRPARILRSFSAACLPTKPVDLLIALVIGAGGFAVAGALLACLHDPRRFPVVLFLGAWALGALRLDAYGDRVTLSLIPVIAGAYLYGPVGGILTGFAAAGGMEIRGRLPTRKSFFNLGLFPLAGLCGALAALPAVQVGHIDPALLALSGFMSASAIYGVNIGILCVAISLDAHARPLSVWRERFKWMLPQTLLLGQVGAGLALAYRLSGLYMVGVFALPVVVMQMAWKQYLAHTTRSVEDLRGKNNDLLQLATRLQTANDTITATYQDTLDALVTALDARDNEVQGHSYRVSLFSQAIAEDLGIEHGSPEFDAIARGAMLHDVGKIGVRDAVLLKPGKLDDAEWVEMRRHSDIGFGILEEVDFLRPAATLVRAHHEKFDGTGYPLQLKGDEIPLGARIFAVADTFDAITTDRPYRKAGPPEAAVAEIKRCAGTQFDPAVVAAFERMWPRLWVLRQQQERESLVA